jgi:hypothetical protein
MVYVDPLMKTVRSKAWPYTQVCHLRADTEKELHEFALGIGLKREWFQNHHPNPRFWHYDLTRGKRDEAIRWGAKALTMQESAAQLMGR